MGNSICFKDHVNGKEVDVKIACTVDASGNKVVSGSTIHLNYSFLVDHDVTFDGCDFEGVEVSYCKLLGCTTKRSAVRNCDIRGSTLGEHTVLTDCTIHGNTACSKCDMTGCTFVDYTEAVISRCTVSFSTFESCNFGYLNEFGNTTDCVFKDSSIDLSRTNMLEADARDSAREIVKALEQEQSEADVEKILKIYPSPGYIEHPENEANGKKFYDLDDAAAYVADEYSMDFDVVKDLMTRKEIKIGPCIVLYYRNVIYLVYNDVAVQEYYDQFSKDVKYEYDKIIPYVINILRKRYPDVPNLRTSSLVECIIKKDIWCREYWADPEISAAVKLTRERIDYERPEKCAKDIDCSKTYEGIQEGQSFGEWASDMEVCCSCLKKAVDDASKRYFEYKGKDKVHKEYLEEEYNNLQRSYRDECVGIPCSCPGCSCDGCDSPACKKPKETDPEYARCGWTDSHDGTDSTTQEPSSCWSQYTCLANESGMSDMTPPAHCLYFLCDRPGQMYPCETNIGCPDDTVSVYCRPTENCSPVLDMCL